ncbi:MAG: nodulation protein NfeD [Chloroflexia bacterium]|nr:nodulation protein NfeD [Chloroflexia bacterium]
MSAPRNPSPSPPGRPRVALALACFLLAALLPLIGQTGSAFAQSGTPNVEVITIDGTITPVMAQYVDRALDEAASNDADAAVIVLDTPGGLSSAMDDIVRDILESEVPVVVYVGPRGARAASAGVYITYSAHVAAMAPGTNIGSASPVSLGGEMDETMRRKVTNDAVAQIRSLADLRGRNADWAEQAVRDAVNVTADDAVLLRVIDLTAPDVPTLLDQIDGRQVALSSGQTVTLRTAGAATGEIGMNPIERFLQLISDPTIAYLLLSIGSLGIFLELSNPGAIVPGVAGALGLLFGLYALGTLPVNWTGLLLILLAFALFIIDVFVVSFGLLLIAGLICFILGSYMLIDADVPGYDQVSRLVIWTTAGCIVAFAAFIGAAVLRTRFKRPTTGQAALIGAIGEVRAPLNPTGLIFLHGELWTATAEDLPDGAEIATGHHVAVIEVKGLRLIVRAAPQPANPARPRDSTQTTNRGEGVLPIPGGVRSQRGDPSG